MPCVGIYVEEAGHWRLCCFVSSLYAARRIARLLQGRGGTVLLLEPRPAGDSLPGRTRASELGRWRQHALEEEAHA